jgi:very-short-patch-repair endonuclease
MAVEAHVCVRIDGERAPRSADAVIGALAAAQHGVVARSQLAVLGIGRGAIDRRLSRGRLVAIHRGVFAVGHVVLTRRGWWMAAVLAAGPGAVLSHRSAAALWGIRDTARAEHEVTVPRHRRCRAGVRVHHSDLPADETTVADGIPVTTPARTLLDLAAVLTPHQLERAVHETEYRRLTSPLSLDALLTLHPKRRGTATLKMIVDRNNLGSTLTRSELEIAFLAFLDAHHLERPLVNKKTGPYIVDALWPAQHLIAELDSRQAHQTTKAFENDRARDRDLLTKGYRVVRITQRQLQTDQRTLATQLGALLARPATRTAP